MLPPFSGYKRLTPEPPWRNMHGKGIAKVSLLCCPSIPTVCDTEIAKKRPSVALPPFGVLSYSVSVFYTQKGGNATEGSLKGPDQCAIDWKRWGTIKATISNKFGS